MIRDVAQPANYDDRVWLALYVDDHLRHTLASHELRKTSYVRHGTPLAELLAKALALEVVRLRQTLLAALTARMSAMADETAFRRFAHARMHGKVQR